MNVSKMRRRITVREYPRTSKLGKKHQVSQHTRSILARGRRRNIVRPITFQEMKKEAFLDKSSWAQPVRVPPTQEIMKRKDRANYIAGISWDEIKTWDTEAIWLDQKVRGVRAILVYDPETDQLEAFSRLGNKIPLRYYDRNEIKNLLFTAIWSLPDPEKVKGGVIVLDTEYYATRHGYGLQQAELNGYVHNPTDPKYRDVESQFHMFDVLIWDGQDVRNLPLDDRKTILHENIPKGGIIQPVKTERLSLKDISDQKATQRISKAIKQASKTGREGVVIKDATSPYLHQRGGALHWIKAKTFETSDLRMKEVHAYPNPYSTAVKDNRFKFYKHWVLITRDRKPVKIKADKGMRGAGFDNAYYEEFTQQALKNIDTGKWKGAGNQIPVHPKYRIKYGRDTVPEKIIIPKKKGEIVEVFVEDMSPDLKVGGTKIVGFRKDKRKADTRKDLQIIYDSFYKVKARA